MTDGVKVHTSIATRVLLGPGARHQLADEVERLGATVVLFVAGPHQTEADELAEALGERLAVRFGRPLVHTPVAVTDEVMDLVAAAGGVDAVVTLGGGSAVGLGKAVSARTGIPQIAIPTTYAGSEVTPVLGETADGVKRTRKDLAFQPGTVVYDPELTLTMPVGLTLTSALNALAHAVEGLWDTEASPVTLAYATEAADGILTSLPQVLARPDDVAARGELQGAAWLAGSVLATARMGLHHQLAHVLGGAYDLPHAELHAMLLAHVMRFNLLAAPRAQGRLARIAGGDPVAAVSRLARRFEGPKTLRELGVPADGLRSIAERVVADPYPNPRALDVESVHEILAQAW
ncbi:maleylacetate reductase [Xylanimonas sp. McL0601]|uniref:maleylacetate reductase n=1 Tax=Xylanimonas sp. McL0601 TaxID=3414739 RepID=UPI003CF593AE